MQPPNFEAQEFLFSVVHCLDGLITQVVSLAWPARWKMSGKFAGGAIQPSLFLVQPINPLPRRAVYFCPVHHVLAPRVELF